MLTTLRHPGCACQQRRLSGHGQPRARRVFSEVAAGFQPAVP